MKIQEKNKIRISPQLKLSTIKGNPEISTLGSNVFGIFAIDISNRRGQNPSNIDTGVWPGIVFIWARVLGSVLIGRKFTFGKRVHNPTDAIRLLDEGPLGNWLDWIGSDSIN